MVEVDAVVHGARFWRVSVCPQACRARRVLAPAATEPTVERALPRRSGARDAEAGRDATAPHRGGLGAARPVSRHASRVTRDELRRRRRRADDQKLRAAGETQQNITFWEHSDKPPRSGSLREKGPALVAVATHGAEAGSRVARNATGGAQRSRLALDAAEHRDTPPSRAGTGAAHLVRLRKYPGSRFACATATMSMFPSAAMS